MKVRQRPAHLRWNLLKGARRPNSWDSCQAGKPRQPRPTGSGGNYVLQSADTHADPIGRRFQHAVTTEAGAAIERHRRQLAERSTELRADISRVAFAHSDIGSRLQSLGEYQRQPERPERAAKSSLSDDLDIDMVQAISDLTGRQYSLQASLQTAASLLQLSMLNYI